MKVKLLWICTLIIAFMGIRQVFSQDIIRLKNGNEIKANVREIETDVIKYKRFDNPEGPSYTLQKSEIATIIYANGTHDEFDVLTGPVNGTFKDARDSKTYKTVTIGNQTWMAENLAYKATKGCWAYNDNEANVAIYGYLYNWETAKTVCPAGWHLPSEAEYKALFDCLGGKKAAPIKLKSNTGWAVSVENDSLTAKQKAQQAKRCIVTDGNGTNESGFSAIPGGWRGGPKAYDKIGVNGYWWSSTQDYDYNADFTSWSLTLYSRYSYLDWTCLAMWDFGYSVRCIKD
ncbi:MAG TPA: FISUMP domain-containing protein [Bacteroidales bacterium]|nr:FISUMP domain-containing protein [Bacteroidales bacterium]